VISQHQTDEDRINAAKRFQQDKNYKPTLVIDTMENTVNDTYAMWPEKAFIFYNGKITYITPPKIDDAMEWETGLEDWLIYFYDEIDNPEIDEI